MELPPPAELELVVAVLDWRDGARRLGGAVVRIDHRDGLALTAPQREADGLLGGLLGTKARTAVHSHQRAHDHKGNEDAAHHQEGHINGLCERITYKSE